MIQDWKSLAADQSMDTGKCQEGRLLPDSLVALSEFQPRAKEYLDTAFSGDKLCRTSFAGNGRLIVPTIFEPSAKIITSKSL